MLDLRNPSPGIKYTYGWRDRSEVLLWASFVLLRGFVEKERPYDVNLELARNPEDKLLQRQALLYNEALDLYKWWTIDRSDDHLRLDALLEVGSEAHKAGDPKGFSAYRELEEALEKKDQEMLHRLIEIRSSLWT
jgi:hypothetical protein